METYFLNVLEIGKLKIKVLEDSLQVSDSKMVPYCLFCMCKNKTGEKPHTFSVDNGRDRMAKGPSITNSLGKTIFPSRPR